MVECRNGGPRADVARQAHTTRGFPLVVCHCCSLLPRWIAALLPATHMVSALFYFHHVRVGWLAHAATRLHTYEVNLVFMISCLSSIIWFVTPLVCSLTRCKASSWLSISFSNSKLISTTLSTDADIFFL